jgi:hypothetical protein
MKRFLISMFVMLVTSGFSLSGLTLAGAAPMINGTDQPAAQDKSVQQVNFPICDRTHNDRCVQLGQNAALDRQINERHPQCAKIANKERKAECVNTAMNNAGGANDPASGKSPNNSPDNSNYQSPQASPSPNGGATDSGPANSGLAPR